MKKGERIPSSIESKILECRSYYRKKDEQMRKKSDGKFGMRTKPNTLDKELTFWLLENDDELEDFLFDDLLAAIYMNDSINILSLPKGYKPLLDVLEFERHCQFEGWDAISNKDLEEMEGIIESYMFVGLNDEAKALRAVTDAYAKTPDDHEEFHEILGNAYKSIENSTPEIEDRLKVIFQFIRNNKELFVEKA